MTVYAKSMMESLAEVRGLIVEDNMDLMRKAAGGSMQTIKMKDGKLKMDSFTASGIMQVYDKVNDKNKKTMEQIINSGKKSQIMKLQAIAMKAEYNPQEEEVEVDEHKGKKKHKHPHLMTKNGKPVEEDAELDEAKYDIYHKDFSSAMQHAYAAAKKMYGITVDPKEIDDKVASGPRKPSSGKTNKYRLKGNKGTVQIQVANLDNKKYELNMYKEEAELDEGRMKELHGYIAQGKSAEWIAKKMGVDAKTIKALMAGYKEAYEVGTNEYCEYLEKLTPGEVDEASARADAARAMRKDRDLGPRGHWDDVDTYASDADIKAASKNILAQMRKAVSLGGRFDVEFLDKKKVRVKPAIANAFVKKYEGMRKPADKEKFQNQAMKSYKDMLRVLKAGYNEEVDLDEGIKVGDNVHLGFGAKGGTGFKGKVIKIDSNNVHIKNPEGKEYKGPMKFVTKEEVEKETILDRIDRKLKEKKEILEASNRWELAGKKFSLINDKGTFILVKQGTGEEKKLKAKTSQDATQELVKKGYRES